MLLVRAQHYDFLFSILLQTEANLEQGVILKDIVTMTDLEVSASQVASSDDIMREISRMADCQRRLIAELEKYERVSTSKQFDGPRAFFVCEDSVEFFSE